MSLPYVIQKTPAELRVGDRLVEQVNGDRWRFVGTVVAPVTNHTDGVDVLIHSARDLGDVVYTETAIPGVDAYHVEVIA